MNLIDAYARDVVAGTVPAGKYHRLACARHLRDRAREGSPEFPYRFDLAKAERFFQFAELLKHYKGKWAGEYIRLQPYQKFRLGSVFAWVHVETGLRRFRTSYHELPRKNGKTLEAAIVMLYLTFYDGEHGAEGYCIATKRDQAKLVFSDCKQLVISSGLKDRLDVRVGNINRVQSASKLEPLGADHDSTDGLNPHAICGDEMHAFKERGMIDVMETATGAREQPHFYKITTAGNDPVSPGGDEHDYACQILDQARTDETYFAFIAHADEGDPWDSVETAKKANPNFGVSVNPDDLAAKLTKAKGIPAAAAEYKQKHLNLWVNMISPCLSMEGWLKGQSHIERTDFAEALEHESCYVGIDLAAKLDLCALSAVFPPRVGRPKWSLLQYIWTPGETLTERAHRDRAPYPIWVADRWLLTTPGTSVDHDVIRDTLRALRERFDIERIGFDPYHAGQIIKQLVDEDGFSATQVLEWPQTYKYLTQGESRFMAEVLAGNVDANGCPVSAWCAANVVNIPDGKGNPQFSKGKSRGRIDPIKAAAIGFSMALTLPVERPAEVLAEWL